MFRYDTIANDSDDIQLSALVILKTGKREMSSIEFKQLRNKNFPDLTLLWDNDSFIFGKFYKFLKRWKEGRLKKKDKEKFADIWSILDDDVVNELIEMIEYALEEKWYEPKTE